MSASCSHGAQNAFSIRFISSIRSPWRITLTRSAAAAQRRRRQPAALVADAGGARVHLPLRPVGAGRLVPEEVLVLGDRVAQQPRERVVHLRVQRVAEEEKRPLAQPRVERRAVDRPHRAAVRPPRPRQRLQRAQPLGRRLAVADPVVVPAGHLGDRAAVGEDVGSRDQPRVAGLHPPPRQVVAVADTALLARRLRLQEGGRHGQSCGIARRIAPNCAAASPHTSVVWRCSDDMYEQ